MQHHKKTKIICTIGPSIEERSILEQLIHHGMNVARLNCSHGSIEERRKLVYLLRSIRQDLGIPLAILLDTKGPEIRLGNFSGQIHLEVGSRWTLVPDNPKEHELMIEPFHVLEKLHPGNKIFLADGKLLLRVVEQKTDTVTVEVVCGGLVSARKSVNIPGSPLDLPDVTEQDIEDLHFAAEEEVDYIAASFVRSAHHIAEIKSILTKQNKSIPIIAKIENYQGVQEFDRILEIADGIMIARGDLGVELPLCQVPRLQKMMVRQCLQKGKLSIIATQMLDSMVRNPRPTRAEVSDVANAIYERTSAVMLSDETAVGKYPIEVVSMMKDIIDVAEKDCFYGQNFDSTPMEIASATAQAAIQTAYLINATAILVYTTTGYTPRILSSMRPKMPILALTESLPVFHSLSLCWGVTPIYETPNTQHHSIEERLMQCALAHDVIEPQHYVVMLIKTPFNTLGITNTIFVALSPMHPTKNS